MIYIDPPYGIKFGSNWQVSTRKPNVKDGSAGDATRQPEQIKAFRDTWKLGIHSYLAYLRDRLVTARDLLTETGSIFVQIGDENVHLVRALMDEVFGSENFANQITFRKTGGFSSSGLDSISDYLIWYCKNKSEVKYRNLLRNKDISNRPSIYNWLLLDDGTFRRMTAEEIDNPEILPDKASIVAMDNLSSMGVASEPQPFEFSGRAYYPSTNSHWKVIYPEGLNRLSYCNRLFPIGNSLMFVRKLDDFPAANMDNIWDDTSAGGFSGKKIYMVQTNIKVIDRCLLMTTDPGDLVLDPTCGSGTTAYIAEQRGRRWLTIDTSRVALALARSRLMSARFPYYLLADSPEGTKKEAEITGRIPPEYKTEGDIRKGFVYKRVPHITLKSIANNPDITEGMTRKEIDEAIARHAETETLCDQPYEDNKRIRVTGPFTVESLSPHRFISLDEERPSTEKSAHQDADSDQFETMILEHLKKAGIQNTIKNERIKFDRLEFIAGEHFQAEGEYTDKEGKSRRVAVFIGPQYGTVSPDMVNSPC